MTEMGQVQRTTRKELEVGFLQLELPSVNYCIAVSGRPALRRASKVSRRPISEQQEIS
jgi:hypothetical protein